MTHPLSRKVIFWPLIPQTLGHFTPYYIKTSDQTEILQARTLCSQKNTPPLKKWEVTISLEREDTIGTGGSSDQPKQISTPIHCDLSRSSLPHHKLPGLLTAHLYIIINFSNCKSSFSYIPKESPYQQRCQVPSYSPLLILAFKLTFRIVFHPFSQKGRAVYLTK